MNTTQPDFDGYKNFIDDLNAREMSNSETYDNSILTLSSAFLGLSLTFINDVIPNISEAESICLLYASWFLFASAIIMTIASFIYGQSVFQELKVGAKKYFIERDKTENKRSEILQARVGRLNMAHGIVFILAVISLTLFISLNLKNGGSMSEKSQSTATDKRSQPAPSYSQTPSKPSDQSKPQPSQQSDKK